MYLLQWTNPALPGKTAITVNVATTNSTAASISLTGKGAANYGIVQQQNQLRILENFASPTSPPFPTIGQHWYDSANGVMSICTSVAPIIWEALGGVQITDIGDVPQSPSLGDIWFERSEYTGFLYVYTGTGRFPPTAWNAYTSEAFPPVSPDIAPYMGIKANFSTFSVVNFGEAYIHGFTGSSPTDTDGQILIDSVLTTVPRGQVVTCFPGQHFLVWDTTATLIASTHHFFSVREVGVGKWEYDNNNDWVAFTPIAGMWVIGTLVISETDDNTAGGITSAVVWQEARPLTSFRSCVETSGSAGIGGWHQIWPAVEHHGARFEYDAMLEKVLALNGTFVTFGGSGAVRGLALADLSTVDAALVARHNAGPTDTLFAPATDTSVIAGEPTSQDWDLLLAQARWAVNRLDLPPLLQASISPVPFTQDGRLAPAALTGLPTTDTRSVPVERRTLRRWGSITGANFYTETMNTLTAAAAQRYSMRGIAGNSGTITTLAPDAASYQHTSHTTTYTGGAAILHQISYNFENSEFIDRFIASGAAIDLKLDYTLPGSPNGNDTAFKSFIDTNNTLRITADKVRVFGNSLPLTLTSAPITMGFLNAAVSPSFATIATITSGSSSLIVSLSRGSTGVAGGASLVVRLSMAAPSPIGGTTTLKQSILRDTKTFGSDEAFFPKPVAFVVSVDDVGTNVVWTNVPLAAAPVVNFTGSVTSGAAPLAVTFTYTGSGSPTLVEWDFTGAGTYTATGTPAPTTYTSPGVYAVRCRATNATGQDVLTRPTYITVS